MISGLSITPYMNGTHAVTDEASGARYALRSDDEALVDSYTSQRATFLGTPVPGYENGAFEGGPPILSVTQLEPTTESATTGEEVVRLVLFIEEEASEDSSFHKQSPISEKSLSVCKLLARTKICA